MKNAYITTPNFDLALNYKVATSSLSWAVIQSHYPEIESLLTTPHGNGDGTAYPEGKGPDSTRWHSLIPTRTTAEQPVVLLVRDPVEKFRSACAEDGITDVDGKLTSLENGDPMGGHFLAQSRFLVAGQPVKLYRFETDLDTVATELGLSLPLPLIPSLDKAPKPDLTPDQLARVQAVYADDIALYGSITEAGQAWTAPPVPATDEDKAAKVAELNTARYEDEVGGVVVDGIEMPTDRETQAKLTAAYVRAKSDSNLVLNWKRPGGKWVELNAPQIIAIGDAVFNHIQAAFDKEKLLIAAVESATLSTELNSINW